MGVRKAERLLNLIVMLLEAPRPVSLQEIHATIPGYGQDQWEAFKRMFERDKQELREMGIPIERGPMDVWETDEGYLISKDRYYLPELGLEPDELAALWLGAGLVRMHDEATVRSAMLKLAYDAPVHQPPATGRLSADFALASPNLPVAFEGVSERKRVTFTYKSRSGEKRRTVDPYGLVHRRGAWYLVGFDHLSEEVRSFRLDRVVGQVHLADPTQLEPDFEPPENFRPEDALLMPPFVQGSPVMHAEVHFDPSAGWWVERSSPWLDVQIHADGSASAVVEVTDADGFLSWILSFGEAAEVKSPPELRNMLGERLAEICR